MEKKSTENSLTENVNTPNHLVGLLEMNIKLSEDIFKQNIAIKKRLTWMVVSSYLRILIVVIPLVVGALYLPSLIKQLGEQYESIFGGFGTATGESVVDLNKILKNISPEQMTNIQRALKK